MNIDVIIIIEPSVCINGDLVFPKKTKRPRINNPIAVVIGRVIGFDSQSIIL